MTDFSDWHAVFDLSLRYAEGIDRRDWALYESCFAPEVRVDFSAFTHVPAPTEPVTASQWVSAVRSTITGFASTQHLIGNHRITIDSPSSARYTAYIQAQHWMSRDEWYLVGGWYENEAALIDGAWRLTALTLHQTWDAGDRGLLRVAGRKAAEA
jgi:hypothetical protein